MPAGTGQSCCLQNALCSCLVHDDRLHDSSFYRRKQGLSPRRATHYDHNLGAGTQDIEIDTDDAIPEAGGAFPALTIEEPPTDLSHRAGRPEFREYRRFQAAALNERRLLKRAQPNEREPGGAN